MYVKTFSANLEGLEANPVEVEIDVSNGLPAFNIVGLADRSINESKDRITVAMKASEFPPPPKRIIVNLAPANVKKEGPHLDLPIAAALMTSFDYIKCEAKFLEDFCFFSELSLTGELKSISGVLPLALAAIKSKVKFLIVSPHNAKEASLAKLSDKSDNNLEIFVIKNLKDLKTLIETLYKIKQNIETEKYKSIIKDLEKIRESFKAEEISLSSFFEIDKENHGEDYAEVIGQNLAKRGLEIAAAGKHHCLMIGPPGCGKSMLAKRFSQLLPDLSFDEAIDVTKIYSVNGLSKETLLVKAPLRSPHHSATVVSLIGGGVPPKPGEASLAHKGVLFLDELTEFNRFVIDQFRQILENQSITLNKSNKCFNYPSDFILIAACNPCPCGYLGDTVRSCNCSPYQISRYISRLSGPFLDRIDLHLQLSRLSKNEMKMLSEKYNGEKNLNTTSTATIKDKVIRAREFRESRLKIREQLKNNQGADLNHKALDNDYNHVIKHELFLEKESREFLNEAINNLNLSARSHQKILKISRTVADLAESEMIKLEHLAEALQFRSLNWENYIQSASRQNHGCFESPELEKI